MVSWAVRKPGGNAIDLAYLIGVQETRTSRPIHAEGHFRRRVTQETFAPVRARCPKADRQPLKAIMRRSTDFRPDLGLNFASKGISANDATTIRRPHWTKGELPYL